MNPDIAQASAAANRIRNMRKTESIEGRCLPLVFDDEKDEDGVKIDLQNVWFRYPTRDVPVLNGLNLTVSNSYTPRDPNSNFSRSRKDNLQLSLDHLVSILGSFDSLR